MSRPVYLDYAAATPADPKVIEAMVNSLKLEGTFANPHAKDHVYGWEAAEVVEEARERVARTIGCSPLEITFTSGATESNNLAIFGLARGLREKGDIRRHIVTTKIEHKAVLEACAELEREGYLVTYLDTYRDGTVDVKLLEQAITHDTFLVSIAQANSVLGSVCDIHALAALCETHDIYFHSDTAQSAGYIKTDFANSAVAMASLTSEKICGPKGVGALYVKRSRHVPLKAEVYGGGQEKGLRGGTVPTHAVAGMGMAFLIMHEHGKEEAERISALRARLWNGIKDVPGIVYNGSPDCHVPGILSVSFNGVDGHMLLPTLSNIAASTGSACASETLKPSYILTAIGHSDDLARASLRLSLGRFTTEAEIDLAVNEIVTKVPKLQAAGSMWNIKKA